MTARDVVNSGETCKTNGANLDSDSKDMKSSTLMTEMNCSLELFFETIKKDKKKWIKILIKKNGFNELKEERENNNNKKNCKNKINWFNWKQFFWKWGND